MQKFVDKLYLDAIMNIQTKEKRRQATQEEKSKYERKRGTVHQTLKFTLI